MDRTIRVRSSAIDRQEAILEAFGREKERELMKQGIITAPLFSAVCVAPALEKGRLGCFYASSRLIVISEEMADEADETTLRNVLLHELAHALDHAIHGHLSGHSPAFRECCSILGLDPGFEKSRIKAGIAGREERKERIRKLLALSSSPFENEASEAIRKAKELMAKDGISMDEGKDERIYMVTLYQARRFPFSVRMLLSYVSDTSGAYVVTSHSADGTKEAVAYGSLEQVETAIYLYDYLVSSTESEIGRLRAEGMHISKDSFMQGAVSALSRSTADGDTDKALAAIQSENMRLVQKLIFPDSRISVRRKRASGGDAWSYQAGKGFGSGLGIPDGIGRRRIGNGS